MQSVGGGADLGAAVQDLGLPSAASTPPAGVAPSVPEGVDAEVEVAAAPLRTQLTALAQERADLMAGAHGMFRERCAVLESAKTAELAEAVRHRKRQIDAAEALYRYHCHAAEQVCQEAKRKAHEVLMAELDERQKQVQEKLNAVIARHSMPGGSAAAGDAGKNEGVSRRKLRSKKGAAEEKADAAGDADKQALLSGPVAAGAYIMLGLDGMPPPPLQVQLPPQDVMSDLKTIYRDWKAAAMRWRSQAGAALIPARVERDKLYYGSEIFRKGDQVTIFSELTKQEFFGTMHILAATEVIVRLLDGTKARVPLQHLRHGRASLYRYGGVAASDGGDQDHGEPAPTSKQSRAARERAAAAAAQEEAAAARSERSGHTSKRSGAGGRGSASANDDVDGRRRGGQPESSGARAARASQGVATASADAAAPSLLAPSALSATAASLASAAARMSVPTIPASLSETRMMAEAHEPVAPAPAPEAVIPQPPVVMSDAAAVQVATAAPAVLAPPLPTPIGENIVLAPFAYPTEAAAPGRPFANFAPLGQWPPIVQSGPSVNEPTTGEAAAQPPAPSAPDGGAT